MKKLVFASLLSLSLSLGTACPGSSGVDAGDTGDGDGDTGDGDGDGDGSVDGGDPDVGDADSGTAEPTDGGSAPEGPADAGPDGGAVGGDGDVPAEWTCNAGWYGDSDCDCGCGAIDTDCPETLSLTDCRYDWCDVVANPANVAECVTEPSCDAFCAVVTLACTEGNAQYDDSAACRDLCAPWALGAVDDTSGDSVGCRLFHAQAALDQPDFQCPLTAALGGGVCTDAPTPDCFDYCGLMSDNCTGGNAQYDNDLDCLDACGMWAYGSLDDTSGNTVGCRQREAALAATDPATACANAAPTSDVCVPGGQ